jgi:hypothetical protein
VSRPHPPPVRRSLVGQGRLALHLGQPPRLRGAAPRSATAGRLALHLGQPPRLRGALPRSVTAIDRLRPLRARPAVPGRPAGYSTVAPSAAAAPRRGSGPAPRQQAVRRECADPRSTLAPTPCRARRQLAAQRPRRVAACLSSVAPSRDHEIASGRRSKAKQTSSSGGNEVW